MALHLPVTSQAASNGKKLLPTLTNWYGHPADGRVDVVLYACEYARPGAVLEGEGSVNVGAGVMYE